MSRNFTPHKIGGASQDFSGQESSEAGEIHNGQPEQAPNSQCIPDCKPQAPQVIDPASIEQKLGSRTGY